MTFTSFFQRGTSFDHVSSEHIHRRGPEGADFKEEGAPSYQVLIMEVMHVTEQKNKP